METDSSDSILRQVEAEVLDTYRRRFPILSREQDAAIEAVFREIAHVVRNLRMNRPDARTVAEKHSIASDGVAGLGHCIRWIIHDCPWRILLPTATSRQILQQEAMAMLKWGVVYHPLWGQHSAYSRGLATISVDKSTKTITFIPDMEVDHRFFVSQMEAKKADDERRSQDEPSEDEFAQLTHSWRSSVHWNYRGLRFNDLALVESGAIEPAVILMKHTCMPELPDTTHLAGVSIGDVRRVLGAIYTYSRAVTSFENEMDDDPNTSLVVPSYIIIASTYRLIEWLATLSGVEEASVEIIISILTFDDANEHLTVAQQPFVHSRSGTIFLLPRLIDFLNLPWAFTSSVNRSKAGNQAYSQAINSLEHTGVKAIIGDLQLLLTGCTITEKPCIHTSGKGRLTPDIVVVSRAERTLLVIDVKYAIPPFVASDVIHRLGEMKKWKKRMSEYVSALRKAPEHLPYGTEKLNPAEWKVFGLILLRWPFPIPASFPKEFHAVDWPSLKHRLQSGEKQSVAELMEWVRTRPDVSVPPLEWKEKVVNVDEWTYRYHVLGPVAQVIGDVSDTTVP